jgi:hypothetical protein
MPLDQSTLGSNINSFNSFKEVLRPYIDIDGQDLIHRNIRDDQFEVIANINEAFSWPSEENWELWRQALRQAFSYSPVPFNIIKLLEIENLSWVLGAPYFLHAPRQGVSNEGLVAYTRRPGNDSVQRSRLSRFLKREIGITDERLIRKFQNSIKLGNTIFELHTTAENIIEGFENCSVASCMKGHRGRTSIHRPWTLEAHPVAAYAHASNDIVLITSRELGATRFNGRCLFNTRSKSAIRIYGNESFHNLIDAVGWNNIDENDGDNSRTWGDMAWVRLSNKRDEDGETIMPYLDGAVSYVVQDPIDPLNTIRCLPDDLPAHKIPVDTLSIEAQLTRGSGSLSSNPSFRERGNGSYPKWTEDEFQQTLQGMDEVAACNQRQFFIEWEEFNRDVNREFDTSVYLNNIIWNNPQIEERHQCAQTGCENTIIESEIVEGSSFLHPVHGYICSSCLIYPRNPDHPEGFTISSKQEVLSIWSNIIDNIGMVDTEIQYYITPEYLFSHPEEYEVTQNDFSGRSGINRIYIKGSQPFAQPFNCFLESIKHVFNLRFPLEDRVPVSPELLDMYIDYNEFNELYPSTQILKTYLVNNVNEYLTTREPEQIDNE